MKEFNVKRITFTDKDNKRIIRAYKLLRKEMDIDGMIKKVSKLDLEMILMNFLKDKNVLETDLDILEKLIIIMKTSYANGTDLISDELYDPVLEKFKHYRSEPVIEIIKTGKLEKNIEHDYPKLKGTLNKAKEIFYHKEHDSVEEFIRKCFTFSKGKILVFRISKKYDGASITETINEKGRIKEALSRGENDKGASLLHLFSDRKYKNVYGEELGIKRECIMTKENYERYMIKRNKSFSNLRSAVVSILTSNDYKDYKEFLTLVPLDGYLKSGKRLTPYELNMFAQDVQYDFTYIEARSVDHFLYEFEELVEKYKDVRPSLNYAIDGLVIECENENVQRVLGRNNDINAYQIAYKFPSERHFTKIKDVIFTIGRTGKVTPMVIYDPIEFNGTKHYKSTLSSADIFDLIKPRVGDLIEVVYSNDVLPYVIPKKARENECGERLDFITHCKCGARLEKIGANYYCTNLLCDYQLTEKFRHFYKIMGFRDVSIKTVETLMQNKILNSFYDLIDLDFEKIRSLDGFGDSKVNNLRERTKLLNSMHIDEARLMLALSIEGELISKSILSKINLDTILMNPNIIFDYDIAGIKEKTKNKFINKILQMQEIIEYFRNKINIVEVTEDDNKPKVLITGFRKSEALSSICNRIGLRVVDSGFKGVSFVVTKDKNSSSKKLKEARAKGIPIYSIEEFIAKMEEEIK